jgi:hypothetical protein
MKRSFVSQPIFRLMGVLLTLTISLLAAATTSYQFGKGFRAAAIQTIAMTGRIEHLRMPVGARTLDDIRTFMIRMDGAQDFARIFVNNYLLIDNESPKDMLFISVPRSDDKREKVLPMAIDRSDYHVGSLSARYYLLKGKNYIIAEVENGYLGCNTVVDIVVNGTQLEHFPKVLPDRLYVEADSVNSLVKDRFEKLRKSAVQDSLCSRRIWEFELE